MATDSKTAGGKHTPMPENEPFYDYSHLSEEYPNGEQARSRFVDPTTNYNDSDESDAAWEQFFGIVRVINKVLISVLGIGSAILLVIVIALKMGLLK